MFVCYGRRTNRYLLCAYGFCLESNKYNSLQFRVWLDFTPKKLGEVQQMPPRNPASRDDQDNKISKVIKLKHNRLRDDLLAYIRMSLITKHEQEQGEKVKDNILISTPVDIEFEMLTMGVSIQLLT